MPGLERELLEGMSFASSPSLDVWLATERRHLQATAEAVLREAALARLAAGAAGEAADLAGRLVRLDPLDENFQALLVRSLAAAGDGVGAARQAAACTELFLRELGVQPGATLNAALHTVTAAPTARPSTGRAGAIAQLEAGEAAIGAGVLDAGLRCPAPPAIVDGRGQRRPSRCAPGRARRLGGALDAHAARGRDEEGAAALRTKRWPSSERAPPPLAAAGVPRARLRRVACVAATSGRWRGCRGRPRWRAGDRAEQARVATVHGPDPRATPRTTAPRSRCFATPSRSPTASATRSSRFTHCRCGAARCCCAKRPGGRDRCTRPIQ